LGADRQPNDSADTAVDPAAQPEVARSAATLALGALVGRYLILGRLGSGGMGVVYSAYDPELDRKIALKLLRPETAAGSNGRARLLREAQAMARLSHPNVVSVFDVGTFGEDVFVAMELVEGTTLKQWLKAQPRSIRDVLEVFLQAGRGLAAAHERGLVHRDFKPDNVIIDGQGRVRVLDFGLARVASGETPINETPTSMSLPPDWTPSSGTPLSNALTRTGAFLGTPAFLSPEQWHGDATDERSDQFSFCIALYEALYGERPFDAASEAMLGVEVVGGRVRKAPAASNVPTGLRAILLRGLTVDRAARFESMEALLGALHSDPALVRHRWLRSALLLVSVAAVVSAAVAGGLFYRSRRDAAEQARLSQRFGQEVAEIAAIARYAALLPLHDTRRESETIRARMEKLKDRMRRLGSVAEGPGHYALGRGHLALERYDEALVELGAAWATGYHEPELAYGLGLAHGQLYQRALADLPKTANPKFDAARREEIARAHRDPALRYLKEAGGHEVGVDAPEYVEGLIALYEQRYEDALVLARRAGERVSWLFEARTLEGDIHFVSSTERYLKGNLNGAAEEADRARTAYHAAAEVAHSSFAALMGECRASLKAESIWVERGQAPEETQKRVLTICSDAATARPDKTTPVVSQAWAWSWLATYQMLHGVDPGAADDRAIKLAERASRIDPHDANTHEVIATADLELADYRLRRGKDPTSALDGAIAEAKRMREADPSSLDAYRKSCVGNELRGEYEASHGMDPRASFRSSIQSSEQALRVSPGDPTFWNGLGVANWATGVWERDHGADPVDAFKRSEEAYRKVAQLEPQVDLGAVNVCSLYEDWARFQMRRGDDARPKLEQAREGCLQAIRIESGDFYAYLYLGRAYLDFALLNAEQTVDPTALLDQASVAFKRASEIDPAFPDVPSESAKALVLEARWLARIGRDPQTAFAKAAESAKRALSLAGAMDPNVLRSAAEVYRWRAEWRVARELSAASDLQQGLAMTARALAENPTHADSAETEGGLQLLAARTTPTPAARAEAARKARTAFERALSINANIECEIRPLLDEVDHLAR
jgi:serine/threonine-protein kinase